MFTDKDGNQLYKNPKGSDNPNYESRELKQIILDMLKERGYKNRTVGIIENGTWAPLCAKLIKRMLEGSKDFAKEFMTRHNIPTAAYRSFTKETLAEADAFLEQLEAPYVLKADGLAAGKGVLILESL